jgi:hypothetical protein
MKSCIVEGDRVQVSSAFFWAKGATGRVSSPPPEVTAISAPWDGIHREEKSALGTNTVYWVWFDEPNTTQMEMVPSKVGAYGKVR